MNQESLFGNQPSSKFLKVIKEHGEVYTNQKILKQNVEKHYNKVQEATKQNEFININLAKKIKDVCLILIEKFDTVSTEEKRYINATVNYFITSEDEEEDLFSPLGFDDDVEILNECLKLIGKESLIIDI
ncbi:hypothetical protein [Aquibacillus albus]|uniref:Uncharacterized membrane protein YkvA (DUF1232 family) n=1 Tax=Aquibacillus albus TaxID=1168171 RepID=A0ABS2N4Y1_9BACI|nr:hypothetical protein [Aquibacillus albus]MBM7572940.1 uncharacterized membrane protein YkvA (DUF1232 family) [Aquibacillus albus]